MTAITYRKLGNDDIGSYRQLRLDCLKNHPDHFGTTYEEELNSGSLKFDKVLASKNTNDFLLGAFADKTLIGICGFIQKKTIKTSHLGDIVQMYVEPAFTGKGVGSQLLKLAVDKAFENKMIDQVLLNVVCSNEKAISTYKKSGFIEYGRIENYFKQGERSWWLLFMTVCRNKELENRL